uniref:Clavesin 1 n=1 Tax=Molossus molossus TaxID=27622 RepID=A0A7J8DSV5_MOLMO|nr:clavesin 1 [Molossus molossus]
MGPVSLLPKYQKLNTWKGDLANMTHLQVGLSPETIEKARLELNENPDVLHQDIQQVRDMIITRPDIGFLRTDDAFILRFLQARKFHQADAFRLLAQYFQYHQLNSDMFKNFKADDPALSWHSSMGSLECWKTVITTAGRFSCCLQPTGTRGDSVFVFFVVFLFFVFL